jgi:conjugative relaxase-like TrwC/TraI family protein
MARPWSRADMNLFRGFSPDGSEKWVHNAGRFDGKERDRMPGFDLTFGLPKSVSIAYAIGSKETREAIERAARGAITVTIGEIEKGCVVRSGKGGKVREEAGIIAAVFQHATARQVDKETPPDMHVHYHLACINTGVTATGKTGALQGRDFLNKTFAKEWGAKFREDLAQGIERAGFEIERTKDGFELNGIPKEAVDHFSKRTAKIEELAPKETHSYREQKKINIKSRVAKGEYEPAALERHWKKESLQFGLTPAVVEGLRRGREEKREERREASQVKDLSEYRDAARSQRTERTPAQDFSQYPDAPGKEQSEGRPKVEPNYAAAIQEKGRREEARKGEKWEALRAIKSEYERDGLRVIGCAFKTADAEEMTKEGVRSYTVARLWSDVKKESEFEKALKKSQGIKTQEDKAREATGRNIYAEFKYAFGGWSAEARDKYKGEYYKPSSKAYHEWLYATHQISGKHRDFLNTELAREERRIDKNTVVLIYGDDRMKYNPSIKNLTAAVEKRGGKAVIVDAQELRMKAQEAAKEKSIEEKSREEERTRVRSL